MVEKNYKRDVVRLTGSRKSALVLFLYALFFVSFSTHPYYVSVTEVEYLSNEKELQIACKIFTDDFEEALSLTNKRRIKLMESFSSPSTDSLIVNYLRKHLQVEVDGKLIGLSWVGKEIEGEAVWCYLSSGQLSAFKMLKINNDLLYHYREDQVNIVHIKAGDKKNSCRLVFPQKNCQLQIR
jgi:hypothetical protein